MCIQCPPSVAEIKSDSGEIASKGIAVHLGWWNFTVASACVGSAGEKDLSKVMELAPGSDPDTMTIY
jgi:hypothetical protein